MDYWNHVLWSDETKINLFGSDGVKRVWRQPGEEYKDKCVLPTVKHGGGSVMVWGCMSAAGTGELQFIEGAMNANMYCDIYPLSTSRNQVLVQSQCCCQFLVGSTGEPFKNRLLVHRLESQYRARTYVTEYVSCFVSLARLRQTQQTCSRCIAPLRSIGTQHTKA